MKCVKTGKPGINFFKKSLTERWAEDVDGLCAQHRHENMQLTKEQTPGFLGSLLMTWA